MAVYRYSAQALRGDYMRAGAGVAMSLALVLMSTPFGIPFWAFTGLTALFTAFGGATALKHASEIELDELGFTYRNRVLRFSRRIEFSDMMGLRLRAYSRRKRAGPPPVVELLISGKAGRITADQALLGFDALVLTAVEAAANNGLTLDSATEANLASLGYT